MRVNWGLSRLYQVSPTAQATRDLDWMRRNTPEDARCYMTDVSGAYATISVMGPRSRELLQHAGTPVDTFASSVACLRVAKADLLWDGLSAVAGAPSASHHSPQWPSTRVG